MFWDSLRFILHILFIILRNNNNTYYKESLYSNLITACLISEYKKEARKKQPSVVLKRVSIEKDLLLSNTQQQTFIMRWNPEISNYKIADFEQAMEVFKNKDLYIDWSIWDYQKVNIGDRFYMIKVGRENTGIVMAGKIVSLPYKDEDWSGRGRDVRYVRLVPYCMVHPLKNNLVTTQILEELFPEENWNEGHSGVLLNENIVSKLDELWNNKISIY